MSDHRVAVVVDREFGERLLPLAQRLHVWVCGTPINDVAGEKAWSALPPRAVWNEVGVTTFRVGENDSPEDMAVSRLVDINEHHPAWSEIEFYGVRPNERLRVALQEYGVDDYRETEEGFTCSRPLTEEK